ncbi:MAG: OmpA family protein [Hyphomicrobium sp.]|nr:OmpA family protein [Hyphomicrobium sp.]
MAETSLPLRSSGSRGIPPHIERRISSFDRKTSRSAVALLSVSTFAIAGISATYFATAGEMTLDTALLDRVTVEGTSFGRDLVAHLSEPAIPAKVQLDLESGPAAGGAGAGVLASAGDGAAAGPRLDGMATPSGEPAMLRMTGAPPPSTFNATAAPVAFAADATAAAAPANPGTQLAELAPAVAPPATTATDGPTSAAVAVPPAPAAQSSNLIVAALPPERSPERTVEDVAKTAATATCVSEIRIAAQQTLVWFEFGSSTVPKVLEPAIARLGDMISACDDARVEISGHTDTVGQENMNFSLSWRRAEAVSQMLSSRGVLQSQYELVGYGARQPLAVEGLGDGGDDSLRRRVEIRIR